MVGAYTIPDRVMGDSRNPHGLPWGMMLKQDMRHFRALTKDNTLIVGANTEPFVRSLHGKFGRHVVVVVSRPIDSPCIVQPTLDDALALVANDPVKYGKPIVGGGARMFEQAFTYLTNTSLHDIGVTALFHATEITGNFPGDVLMPEFPEGWIEQRRIAVDPEAVDEPNYSFVTYRFN